MKRFCLHKYVQVLFHISLGILVCQCSLNSNSMQKSLKSDADQIKVIDTHEHQHWPEEFGDVHMGFYHVIYTGYLMHDLVSAGSSWMDIEILDSLCMDAKWELFGKSLNYCRAGSYYGHFIKGFQKLYDFDDLYFTPSNIPALSRQIEKNYSDYRSWFDTAFHKAGFELMFLDQYWRPFNTDLDPRYFALVFHINPLVMQISQRPAAGEEPPSLYDQAKAAGFVIKSLDDYLKFCEHLFEKNIAAKTVCVKNSLAYSRTLYFEDVPYAEANRLFQKDSNHLSQQEAKKLQDFMFHWIIQKSIHNDLPIQIHTGYLAGNGNTLENGKPVRLNNLFLKYHDVKFVLFHGGYPWTGEYAALGKMFPNVYLDLVWLPQISRQEAVQTLEEILDGVPYNKLFWGGDCSLIEESTGSLEFGKDIVSEVLSRRISRGLLTEDVAIDILQRIFRENAIEVFKLEEKLGRKFKVE
ncbi:amidohydrolase family protein [candidate division KSB1 bacterium]|nr:amidohydrolase family protein [candidate division KSB1 bacterium]